MYIYGGCRHRDDSYLDTLFRFDPKTSMWHKLKPFGLRGALSRKRHCGVIVGDCAYIFCGVA